MNLDELQSVQSRERQTDSLQQLRESFYADAGEFIQGLREERDRAAERADDPFDAPEVNRLTDDIKTAEQTVEAIYERRVGKIVKMASLAAADMPAEEEGLTREERDLFESLVGAIEDNRDHVLDVLAGETATGAVAGSGGDSTASNPTPGPTEPAESAPAESDASTEVPAAESDPGAGADESVGVDAADVMGADGDESTEQVPPPPPEEPPEDAPIQADAPGADDSPAPPDAGSAGTAASGDGERDPGPDGTDGGDQGPDVDRATVRITDDVGEIFGVDQREYDLSTDDVVTLPEENAAPLVQRDAAERLE